jgi:hypothetical protein
LSKIIFTDTVGISENYRPIPAHGEIPSWYKNIDSYIGQEKKPVGNGSTTATIKRCMPVFDAMVSGYILLTYVDIFVSQKKIIYLDEDYFIKNKEKREFSEQEIIEKKLKKTNPHYEWPSLNPIDFHPIEQAPNHPSRNGHHVSYPKWINPWAIKTPPGYSTLFVQPFHRESVFTILPGIVDTDTYSNPVNFPFTLNDVEFEGLIPAGTPMAQVIPFKRESWEMSLGSEKELKEHEDILKSLRTKFFDAYKNQFRQVKEYK